MGWLDVISVGLNLTNAAMNASNAAKLQEMQRQGATADSMRALTSILRDQIFRYKQTAEAILAGEAKSPKIAAGSMKFLEINLDESQISPSLFLELGDKEYCVNTTRLIRENSARMFGHSRLSEKPSHLLWGLCALAKPILPVSKRRFGLPSHTCYDFRHRYRVSQ